VQSTSGATAAGCADLKGSAGMPPLCQVVVRQRRESCENWKSNLFFVKMWKILTTIQK